MSDEVNSVCSAYKEIESLLEDVAKQESFHSYKIQTTHGSEKGDGYLGIITNISLIGKNEENKKKVVNLVVKTASKSDALRTEVPIAATFGREIYMYNTVFPTFWKFEAEKGLPPFSFVPKFYTSQMTHKCEALILENLKENGYGLHERSTPLDEDHVSLVATEYGRLHALSLAVKDQNPEKFETLVKPFDDLAVKLLKILLNTFTHQCTKILETFDLNTDVDVIKIFGSFVNKVEPYLNELTETNDDYSVILHGDCWTNNIMFKYEDTNDPTKPTEVCLIDFQLSSMGSPVLDFASFFYSCCSKEVINELDYYKDLYYNSISTYLQELGSDPDKVFPYSVLQEQWKRYAKFGLIMAVINIHATLTEKEEAIDFNDLAESGESVSNAFSNEISNIDEYNDRIRHVIIHFIEHDFI